MGTCEITDSNFINLFFDRAKSAADSLMPNSGVFVREYDSSLEKDLHDEQYIITNIDHAIAGGQIRVYYQPIIKAGSGKLCGFEALARWVSPELGFLQPCRFISFLEKAHLIHKLDSFIIGQICHDVRARLSRGLEAVPVSFNLSRLDFQLCNVFEMVERAVILNGLPRSMINIEITESILSGNEFVQEVIEKLHRAGYQVWMDDFGSGYSSLNTLKDYDFDKLKIDMEFLSSFTDRSKDILASIVEMAKKLGIRTLAEGCETGEQLAFLRDIGCEEVQGYYFGKPLPIDECWEQAKDRGITADHVEKEQG